MKDEEMSRFLTGDTNYKKRHAAALLNGAGSAKATNEDGVADVDGDDDDDDDIDYGFDNPNQQIVNRASRLAAQEVLMRVRRKSARYIMRKREEADFYKTIERDLTLALEEEESVSSAPRTSKQSTTTDDARSSRRRSQDIDAEDKATPSKRRRPSSAGSVHEFEEDAEDDDGGDAEGARSHRAPTDADGEAENEAEDTFSDLDDDEISSLLLTREEADKKKLLWEKMNKDYIQEQVRHQQAMRAC